MSSLREQLLNASDEIRKKIKVPFQVRKDKKSLESWLIDVESAIADLEFNIKELKGSEAYDPDEILDAVDELALKQRRLAQGEALLTEMFEEIDPVAELNED